MCGIVGAASSWLSDHEKNAFKNLLYTSVFRGWDSTGVISVQETPGVGGTRVGVKSIKSTLAAPDFLAINGKNKEIFNTGRHVYCLIGHTRAATVGAVSKENAHPFSFANVVGVHNGTIRRKKWGTEDKFETDSEALYNEINERGIRAVIKDLGRHSYNDDAYALVFFDRQQKTLNMIRNTERPLSITEGHGTVYWASESKMLDFIINRQNGKTGIQEIKPYHLYTWKLGGAFSSPTVEDLTPPLTVIQRPKVDPYDWQNHNWSNYGARRQVTPQKYTKEIPMDGYVKVWDEPTNSWILVNWMHPSRKDIKLNTNGELPDGWLVKNGLIVPKELVAVTPAKPSSNTDMQDLVEAMNNGDAQDNVVPFDDLSRGSGVQDCKVVLMPDRRNIPSVSRLALEAPGEGPNNIEKSIARRLAEAEDFEEERVLKDINGEIFDEDEVEEAVEAGCKICHTTHDLATAVDHADHILGQLTKNDVGGYDFCCAACVRDEEQKEHSHPLVMKLMH